MNKEIKKLIENLNCKVFGDEMQNINHLIYDSRNVEKNDMFVCLKGVNFDAHTKIDEVIDKGVKALVVQNDIVSDSDIKDILDKNKSIVIISVNDTRMALSKLSKNYFDNPQKDLKVIGITGTKGKTTTTFMIKGLITSCGYKVGVIGTIGIIIDDNIRETNNTTPESFVIQEAFREMVDKGCKYCIMEVSSQALKYGRVLDIDFDYALWTNITYEHIGENEHTDFNDYLNSKLKIFEKCKVALVEGETDYLDKIFDETDKNNIAPYIVYNDKNKNIIVDRCFDKSKVIRADVDFDLKIWGEYNKKNARLAFAFANIAGFDLCTAKKGIENVKVPGRCEVVYDENDVKIVVDFSYEKESAKNFLTTIKTVPHKRIVTIYGCGGNRSKDRRSGMAEITGTMADFIILTSDNSRFEKTADIIKEIETTLTKYKKLADLENGYIIIEDRRKAIEYAIKNKKPGDIICVMGKGHEPTMEMMGQKIHFLDKEVIDEIVSKNYE